MANLKSFSTSSALLFSLIITTPTLAETHGSAVDTGAPIASIANLASLAKVASDARPSSSTVNYNPNIKSFTTAAGTPVLFVRARELPIVDVRITFNAGSARDEAIKPKAFGLAALTAAMLTKGTHTRSEEDINQTIEQYGLSLRSQSYKDMFVVSFRSLSDSKYLNQALSITADMLSNSNFPTAALERTRAQSLVALKQANEKPNVIATNAFFDAIYGNHPYAHPTAGTLKSLPGLTQADLMAFKNTFLVASNASIAITGDVTETQAAHIADALTKKLPIGNKAFTLPKPVQPEQDTPFKHIHIPFYSTQTHVIMGQLGITRQDPRAPDLTVSSDIFGGGEFHAHLMRELREKRGLTYGAYASFSPMQVAGPYMISYSTRNDKAAESIAVTKKTLTDYLNLGASKKEVRDTKTSQINQFPLTIASNQSINGWLGMMAFYNKPLDYISTYTKHIEHVTQKSANQAFSHVINPAQMVVVTVGPKKP